MLNLIMHIPIYLAQAYGRGTYNSLKYQDARSTSSIALPITLPSVGTTSIAIASVIALAVAIWVFMLTKKRRKQHQDQKLG